MRIDIGEIIRKRIATFPALDKEPKKAPAAWGLFPEFTLTENQLAENLEYRYPVMLRSDSPAELQAMIDRAISAGREPIETEPSPSGFWEIWLHATGITPPMRVRGTQTSEARIIYKFRARRIIYAPAEAPSGSIAEVPRELAPEDLKKEKNTEEVKHE